MHSASKDIRSILTQAGYRVTHAREEIIRALSVVSTPCTIQEISADVDSDPVSVYRNIALFLTVSVIEEIIGHDGVRRYALRQGHHDHIVCRGCGFTAHIPCPAKKMQTLPKNSAFASIVDHTLTYYGLCTKCAQ